MTMAAPMSDGIGIANLPNQVSRIAAGYRRVTDPTYFLQRHKIVAKRGAHFTLMVVGQSIPSFESSWCIVSIGLHCR